MSGVTAATRVLVYARANNRCELCGNYAYGGSVHHRRRRGMGGSKNPATNKASNLLLLCGSGTTGCHGTVESDLPRSYENGWVLRQGTDPLSEPVWLQIGRVLLDNHGNYNHQESIT